MPAPRSTYRLQLALDFDLFAAAELTGYLRDLGVTHVYASPLFALGNVIASPHLAGIDETSEAAMADRAIDAILAVHRGAPPPRECIVNPEALRPR